MEQKKVSWDDATPKELKMFCAQVLGIMTTPNIGETALRSKIRQAYSGTELTIMVPEDDGPADAPAPAVAKPDSGDPPAVGKALRGSSAESDPKVKVTIAEVEGAGGTRDVYVGVNGVGMMVPRGRPVDIPYRYFHALENAVKTNHEQDPETNEIVSSEVPSYPMSVNKMPDQAEIDAYLAAD